MDRVLVLDLDLVRFIVLFFALWPCLLHLRGELEYFHICLQKKTFGGNSFVFLVLAIPPPLPLPLRHTFSHFCFPERFPHKSCDLHLSCSPYLAHTFDPWCLKYTVYSSIHLFVFLSFCNFGHALSHLGNDFKNVRNWRSFCRKNDTPNKISSGFKTVATLLKLILGFWRRQLRMCFEIIAYLYGLPY